MPNSFYILGSISIAFVDSNSQQVLQVRPISGKYLAVRAISDLLFDLNSLTILHPNKSKTEAFGKYKLSFSSKPCNPSQNYPQRVQLKCSLENEEIQRNEPSKNDGQQIRGPAYQ